MNDTSNPDPDTPNCPACGSEHTAEIADATADYDYRCHNCGERFNEDGRRAVIP